MFAQLVLPPICRLPGHKCASAAEAAKYTHAKKSPQDAHIVWNGFACSLAIESKLEIGFAVSYAAHIVCAFIYIVVMQLFG